MKKLLAIIIILFNLTSFGQSDATFNRLRAKTQANLPPTIYIYPLPPEATPRAIGRVLGVETNGQIKWSHPISIYNDIQKDIRDSSLVGNAPTESTWYRDTTSGILKPAHPIDSILISNVFRLDGDFYAPNLGFQMVPADKMNVLVKNDFTGLIHTYPISTFGSTILYEGVSGWNRDSVNKYLYPEVLSDPIKVSEIYLDSNIIRLSDSSWLIGYYDNKTFADQDNIFIGNDYFANDSLRNSFIAVIDPYKSDGLIKGQYMVSIGALSGLAARGSSQVNIGMAAGYYFKGDNSVNIGQAAGSNSTLTNSVSIGANAGNQANGQWMTAIGFQAGYANTGDVADFAGWDAGNHNSGDWVAGFGVDGGHYNSGDYLAASGIGAGYYNRVDSVVAFGLWPGYFNRGRNSTFLGIFNSDSLSKNTKPFVTIIGAWQKSLSSIDTACTYLGGDLYLYDPPHFTGLTRGNKITFNDGVYIKTDSSEMEISGGVEFDKGVGFDEMTSNDPSAGACTIDWSEGNIQSFNLTDDTDMDFTAPSNICHLTLKIIHANNATSYTITWPGIKWPGGTEPTLTQTANAVDIISIFYDGTNYYGMYGTDFK